MRKRALVCLFTGSLLVVRPPGFSSEDAAARLAGLWDSERSLGPELRGELTLVREESGWRASIAGFDALVRVDETALTFLLPGNRGKFCGRADR
jgi:hypothetical protein